MSSQLPMLDNILSQAASLGGVLRFQTGGGADALAACARLLRAASGRIILSGMGASFFAAMPSALAMARMGRAVHLAESAELLHFGEGSWGPGDVAVLISRSGASIEVLRLAELLRAAGVRLVGVTNIADSPLAQMTDELLLLHSEADQIIAVQTYTGTLLAMLLLAEQVGPAREVRLAQECADALPGFARFVSSTTSEREQWDDFLNGQPPIYLLGRGAALAAAHEGSLLFHETSKLSAIALSSGQFRHGPVEAIAAGTQVILIGSPEPTRALDARLALDLAAMGARVRWVGPLPETLAPGVAPLGAWPTDVPASLQPIFDVVPLQVAAYASALRRGVSPGSFRFASEITRQEAGFPLFEETLA